MSIEQAPTVKHRAEFGPVGRSPVNAARRTVASVGIGGDAVSV